MKQIVLFLLLAANCLPAGRQAGCLLFSQTTNIFGTINIYTPVTAISCNSLTVGSAAGYNVGDTVLIIQMKGGDIDLTNTAAFGSVIDINEAGNYEFNRILSISGSVVNLQYALSKPYNLAGLVQLIRVPYYNDVTISSTLTAQPWNGSTGGVLAFQAAGTVTMNADMDVSGLGFRGGSASKLAYKGCSATLAYYYTMVSGSAGQKGEGITAYSPAYEAGRGALANGGGGGNNVNAGGAGGGNYALGGRGGDQAVGTLGCQRIPIGGEGGYALTYNNAQNKIFMGGGGGGGHQNDPTVIAGTAGTNGGGIIIIRADTIVGNSFSIISNGIDNNVVAGTDGAGGGGGGGTILLDVKTYNLPLTVQANGGKGGNQSGSCHGTGGGGGGGVVWASGASLPLNVSLSFSGGAAGITSTCGKYGATAGAAGGILNNLKLTQDTVSATTPIIVTMNSVNASCKGSCNGKITVVPTFGSAPFTYLWNPSTGGQTTQTATGLCAGNYTVFITDANRCGAMGKDTVHQPGQQLTNTLTSINAACGCNGMADDYASGGTPPYNYLWNTTQTTSSITGLCGGTYQISLSDSKGCSATSSVTISQAAQINIAASNDTSICSGTTISLSAAVSGNSTNINYVWYPGNRGGNTIAISPLASTTYTVIATNTTINSCADTTYVTVNVVTTPIADAGDDITICSGRTVHLQASGGINYSWSPETYLSNSLTANPSTNPASTISYEVLVSDTNNCKETDSVTVYISREDTCGIHIYNGITPNGDGDNDDWVIEGIQSFPDNQVFIFNRWGSRVWTKALYDNNQVIWRGSNEQEKKLPSGTYYYVIELYVSGGTTSYSGWVEVTH